MRRAMWTAAISLVLALSLGATAVSAQDEEPYAPTVGDEVVIYTHHFLPEHYDEARHIVAAEFTGAMRDLGQSRHTYWIEDPDTNTIVAVSFFQADESVDEWQAFQGRLDTLDKLEPMRSEPMTIGRYRVYAITNTDLPPGEAEASPAPSDG